MVKTGTIQDILNIIAMLASLAPALIILFRRAWQSDVLNFLMVFSLLSFMHGLLTGLLPVTQPGYAFTHAAFSLGEFILLLFLLRPNSKQRWMRDLFYIFSIAFLSVIITVYALMGANASASTVQVLQNLILLAAAIYGILQLLKTEQVFIFQQPLFWIIIGAIAFSCMQLLLAVIPSAKPGEMAIMQALVVTVRSLFFIVAAGTKMKNPAVKTTGFNDFKY
ncbi:MAG: hypothetical protein ACTHMC_15075 [Pseudobacter sp.]|uniref:hypothetical protein n=1 Tax=Pseudobacter sp. TaxID=2045420 RepID=UPI003F7E33EC